MIFLYLAFLLFSCDDKSQELLFSTEIRNCVSIGREYVSLDKKVKRLKGRRWVQVCYRGYDPKLECRVKKSGVYHALDLKYLPCLFFIDNGDLDISCRSLNPKHKKTDCIEYMQLR